eukprot:scaffold46945_cov17-Tisochrysis_lutea.AAC.3
MGPRYGSKQDGKSLGCVWGGLQWDTAVALGGVRGVTTTVCCWRGECAAACGVVHDGTTRC